MWTIYCLQIDRESLYHYYKRSSFEALNQKFIDEHYHSVAKTSLNIEIFNPLISSIISQLFLVSKTLNFIEIISLMLTVKILLVSWQDLHICKYRYIQL